MPLGGLRAIPVRRTLPQRPRSLVGAWCFVDHYGPDRCRRHRRHEVAPHPHTGLQTVSWLFTGEIEHRDSAGHRAMVRPGEVNLMTAGHGISHSEVSTPGTPLCTAPSCGSRFPTLPGRRARLRALRAGAGGRDGWEARVFLGSLLGDRRRSTTAHPAARRRARARRRHVAGLEVDPTFEHGVLVDPGVVHVDGVEASRAELAYVPPGRDRLALDAGAEPARVLLLGGPPFGEPIVMWWNFVGRSHEEIVAFREEWQGQIDGERLRDGRFGIPVDDASPPVPAPALPNARLKERR